ncbi:TraR/DksA C4-type zinc finger protein [Patescibacteria group bacterium]|nr:TraR/DksA C4-type zinc finger protein [Patescibacteria group bacterium]MBU1500635.1 TraR/DksA C4-type zinc finger protein [Patescibacteria group bacterium]MBU2080522.1 TraR/DksA C4-type zinc finger protein [Patescibacteria group bacterium]MBU2123673.1 TraR/DksA C4-type zinc finger protein [Patescibacteria group bacterium]MBU2194529.1 TraR/DksA C4-type zinc finger protein [Patescibacteria group bacterium]
MNTDHFLARLTEEKATLEAELQTIGRRNPENPNDWEALPQETGQEADRNDAADLISHYEDNTAILKDLEIRYNEVLAALTRIENGTYGTCAVTGEPIEEARLEADPAARTCKTHINA